MTGSFLFPGKALHSFSTPLQRQCCCSDEPEWVVTLVPLKTDAHLREESQKGKNRATGQCAPMVNLISPSGIHKRQVFGRKPLTETSFSFTVIRFITKQFQMLQPCTYSLHKTLKHMNNSAYNKCRFHMVGWATLFPLTVLHTSLGNIWPFYTPSLRCLRLEKWIESSKK